jgi:excisionase family DNA binding protein
MAAPLPIYGQGYMALRVAFWMTRESWTSVSPIWESPGCKMLVDFVDPVKWYTVNETAAILGFGRDKIIRLIEAGELEALTMPERQKRKRGYKSRRIQGAEILRFVQKYLKRAA